jgi:hypothetical protein
MAERRGRYAAPISLAFAVLYITRGNHSVGSFARQRQLVRCCHLPTLGHALLLSIAGATVQTSLEAALLRERRLGDEPWLTRHFSPAAATSVTRERHGRWFEERALRRAEMTNAERRAFDAERWLFTAKLVLLAPLLEELLFRRLILLNLCSATRSAPLAVGLSSVGFGAGHMDWSALLEGTGQPVALPVVETVFGVVASVSYLLSGRLAVPVAMHIIVNGAALVAEAPAAIPCYGFCM